MFNYVKPFNETGIMENETIMLLEDLFGKISAKLLFKPIKILSIKSTSGAREYKENVDYKVVENEIIFIKDMPYFTQKQYFGEDLPSSIIEQMAIYNLNILYTMSSFIFEKQLFITYTYDKRESFYIKENNSKKLPKIKSKLKNKENVKILWYGDSISNGGDSSKLLNVPPYMPPLSDLIKLELEKEFNVNINLNNVSESGMTSAWAVDHMQERIEKNCDLLILAWGMNDGTAKINPYKFLDNLIKIIEYSKAKEFLIISPIIANAHCGFNALQDIYEEFINTLKSENIAVVEMSTLHKKMLLQKKYIDLSSNNVNHPNDFLIRCYAQKILEVITIS